jgi:hypothetical protein
MRLSLESNLVRFSSTRRYGEECKQKWQNWSAKDIETIEIFEQTVDVFTEAVTGKRNSINFSREF